MHIMSECIQQQLTLRESRYLNCWHAVQGIAIPTHTMFTEDYIKEAVVDNVLSQSSGDLTFADLGINPQRIDIGLPIEHVRHFRIGGGSLFLTSNCMPL